MGKKLCIIGLIALIAVSIFAGGQKEKSNKLIIWDKSEYVAEYNQQSRARFEQFGREKGVEVEYVIVPPNDLKSKLLASIEAGNPPDLVVTDEFLAKQFAGMNQLVDVSDLMASIPFIQAGRDVAYVEGGSFLVPISILAPGMYIRKDKWDAAGLELPTTWEDVYKTAKIVNDPANGFYALGYPMGISGGGDAESMARVVILSFGGEPVDKDGNVTVNSPETLEAFKFIAKLYNEGLTPPSAITWDDMGNNTAYIAGSVGIIQNSASVFAQLKTDKPDIYANTVIMPYPAGPAGQFSLAGGNVFAIFKNGKNTEMAKEYVKYFFEKDFYSDLIIAMGGMWQPTLEGADEDEFWSRPENKGWLESSKTARPNTYPAAATDVTTKAFSEQLTVKAIQKIVLRGTDPQVALNELEADLKRVLGK